MNDMKDEANKRFLERACASLDERSQRVEPHIASRLRLARSQAIESKQQHVYRGWMPAMASAFAVVIAVGLWFGSVNNQDIPQDNAIAQISYEKHPADLDMLAVANGLELFQELEFYTWLEQEDQNTANS
ncbi:MAG: DUF3619 family protein [Gammaproteobacteria bacterium]|nr:DUF3619 family protein [Gammaproteobacteria bacterium]MCW8986181.1 DUF3619 family protein [Gammaproteobacteria bacterium]